MSKSIFLTNTLQGEKSFVALKSIKQRWHLQGLAIKQAHFVQIQATVSDLKA